MSEIRQIQLDGVNYDLVITEDEVSATRAEQAAQRATQQATYASNYAIQAGNAVTNAEEYAQDAQDAADRAEAIVGGQFVSYGQSQGLTDSEKETARTNIGASTGNNPNLVKNGWFRINSKNKSTYSPDSGSTLDCWRFGGQNDTDTITVLADGIQVVGSGTTRVYQDYASGFQAVETGKTYTLSVLVTELNGTCQAVWYAGTYFNLSVGLNTYTGVATSEMKAVYPIINLNGTIKIKATKLEVGTVSTLMNNVASDDNLEIIRCNYPTFSNPNLLDNAYFVGGGSQLGDGHFPINQRGQTSYAWSGATCIDRWYIFAANDTVTLSASGLTVNANENGGVLGQRINYYPDYSQQPLICTFLTTDNKRIVWSFTINTSIAWQGGTLVLNECPDFYVDALYDSSSNTVAFVLAKSFDNIPHSITLKAAKLELGTVSTLANDAPPNFKAELAKCQRYLWVETFGANTPIAGGLSFGTSVVFDLVVPVPMRKGATIGVTFTATPYFAYDNQLLQVPAGTAYASGMNGNHLRLQIGTNGADIGAYKHVDLLIGIESVVTVSCEL